MERKSGYYWILIPEYRIPNSTVVRPEHWEPAGWDEDVRAWVLLGTNQVYMNVPEDRIGKEIVNP